MWELLDLSRNVWKIVAFNYINHVCIGGILHLLRVETKDKNAVK